MYALVYRRTNSRQLTSELIVVSEHIILKAKTCTIQLYILAHALK